MPSPRYDLTTFAYIEHVQWNQHIVLIGVADIIAHFVVLVGSI